MLNQQEINFNGRVGKVVINPPGASPESITTMTSFKAKQSEIDEFSLFCGRNDLSRSEGIRDALKWYMAMYPHKEKIQRYWQALTAWLTRLP